MFTDEALPLLTDEVKKQIALENLTAATPLLEHGRIPYAEPIANPEALPTELLGRLWGLGHAFVRPFSIYDFVAFTQFLPKILKAWGLPRSCPRIIFGSFERTGDDNFKYYDYLLINPEIRPTSDYLQCVGERCGSLAEGNLNMWVIRPYDIEFSAYVWQPGMPCSEPISCAVWDVEASMLQHELAHLNGLTAASESFRRRLVDFRFIPDTVALGLTVPQLTGKEIDFNAIARKTQADWLVWNPDRERLEVINYKGDYIRDY